MSGQSITDRIAAAQHSMTGSAISKAVCKATTHEVSAPKKKHLDCRLKQGGNAAKCHPLCFALCFGFHLDSLFADRSFSVIYNLSYSKLAYFLTAIIIITDHFINSPKVTVARSQSVMLIRMRD